MGNASPVDRTTKSIRALVQKHRKLKNEPLHLAAQLRDPKHPKDIVLLEVIGGFGGGHIDPDKRFLERSMSASSDAVLEPGGELRFILTSPEELKAASKGKWPSLQRLKGRLELVTVHHTDAIGEALQPLILPEA